jgi:hypothetical protein
MQIKCGGRAWPSQAKGAVHPRGSLRTFSRGQILSADIVIAHWTAHEPSRRFPPAYPLRPLSVLTQDLAGNQYT